MTRPLPPEQFQQRLLAWFERYGRKDLPWQQAITPYRVWLSEIMLQQTQVSSVIPYFNRFIERFPTLADLAAAELDDVLPLWAGLGYYARARNLHKTARLLQAAGGEFPLDIEHLSALPGIGRSTAGAILSIAGGQSQPILDGNVKRVLARQHAVTGWPGDAAAAKLLWNISAAYTPRQNAAAYTQAIMDLGATLCRRSKPLCEACPVAEGCQALAQNAVAAYPAPKPRKTQPVKTAFFLLLQDAENRFLLEKRPPAGIWGGLWSAPEFLSLDELAVWLPEQAAREQWRLLPEQRHTFSHYHLDFTPVRLRLQNPINKVLEANRWVWYNSADITGLGLPAPVKRLFEQINNEDNHDQNGKVR